VAVLEHVAAETRLGVAWFALESLETWWVGARRGLGRQLDGRNPAGRSGLGDNGGLLGVARMRPIRCSGWGMASTPAAAWRSASLCTRLGTTS